MNCVTEEAGAGAGPWRAGRGLVAAGRRALPASGLEAHAQGWETATPCRAAMTEAESDFRLTVY